MDKKLVFEVEHEIAPIRHAYVICPGCGNKFAIEDFSVGSIRIHDDVDLISTTYECPICGLQQDFTSAPHPPYEIREVPFPLCAKGAKVKKTIYE